MLNLRTLEFIPHDRDFLATVKLGVTWHGEKPPKPERWLRFLGETVQTPEVIMQLQEFIGYSMTRDTTMGKALLLLGPGADGKSKVISIMRALVGQKNCSAVTIAGLKISFSGRRCSARCSTSARN